VCLSHIRERGKVSENVDESSSAKSPHVFHEDVARSKLANETRKLSPQSRLLTFQTGTLAGERDVGAGEASADDVGLDSIGSKPGSVKFSDIVVDRHVGPVLAQDAPAELVDLAEGHRLEPAGALKSQAEAAQATEQVQNLELRGGTHAGLAFSSQWARKPRHQLSV
jgi:hypothetical protein